MKIFRALLGGLDRLLNPHGERAAALRGIDAVLQSRPGWRLPQPDETPGQCEPEAVTLPPGTLQIGEPLRLEAMGEWEWRALTKARGSTRWSELTVLPGANDHGPHVPAARTGEPACLDPMPSLWDDQPTGRLCELRPHGSATWHQHGQTRWHSVGHENASGLPAEPSSPYADR